MKPKTKNNTYNHSLITGWSYIGVPFPMSPEHAERIRVASKEREDAALVEGYALNMLSDEEVHEA